MNAPLRHLAPPPPARWSGLQRVLALRLDNLGDLLMTTPALAALRESLPGARLTLLASPAGAALAPHLPLVDEVWSFAAPWMQGADAAPAHGLGCDEAALVDRLAETGFDAAVIFTVCTQSALPAALLCRMAGIPLRLAYSRENPYGLLSHWLADPDQVVRGLAHDAQAQLARHEVERQLALVASVGCGTADERLRFEVRSEDRRKLQGRLHAAGIGVGSAYAVLHPGASAESRRWPAEHFGAVARRLAAEGLAVVLSGSFGEMALCEEVLQTVGADVPHAAPAGPAPIRSLAGRLGLGELAALIEGAQVVVSNNSAPAHLAAALGTPVVDLYALTNPQHTPWRVPARVLHHDVPCRWCLKSVCPEGHHDCLRRVEPPGVAAAALELMRARSVVPQEAGA